MRRPPLAQAFAPALVAAILLLLWLPAAPAVAPKTTRFWRGYYTLLFRPDRVGEQKMLRALAAVGPGVVSSGTTPVSFSDLETTASCLYSELPGRLDPSDPRFDAYLRGIGRYFSASTDKAQWRVAYIPARRTSLATFRRLARLIGAPSRGGWRLAEFDPVEKAPILLAALAFGLLASLPAGASARKRRDGLPGLALCCALCWLPFLASGGIAELAFVLALFPSWLGLARTLHPVSLAGLRRGGKTALALYGGLAATGMVALLLIAGFSWFRLFSAVSSTVCSVLVLGLQRPLAILRKGWIEKRAFPSAPLIRRTGRPIRRRPAAALLLTVSPLLLALIPLARAPLLPLASALPGVHGFSWSSVRELEARRAADDGARLPDIADFLTHTAYQQTFMFGRPYALPTRDERVTVTEYMVNQSTGVIVPRQRTLRTFDSVWLEGAARDPAPSSLERLLRDQGRPVIVRMTAGRRALVRELIAAALCACTLLATFARDLGLRRLELRHLIRGGLWRFTIAARKNTTR
jgi:hypothetical protein